MTRRHSKGHWRCPDCGVWCDCAGDAAKLAHVPCRLVRPGSTPLNERVGDARARERYARWLTKHA